MLKTNCRSFKNDFAVCKFLNLGEEEGLDVQVVQICVKNDRFILFYKGEEEDVDKLNTLFRDTYFEDCYK